MKSHYHLAITSYNGVDLDEMDPNHVEQWLVELTKFNLRPGYFYDWAHQVMVF